MTSSTNEQQRVDVLAVMDEATSWLPYDGDDDRILDRFAEARAAVAELIETQRELLLEIERARDFETSMMQRIPSDTLARANAALANVGAQK